MFEKTCFIKPAIPFDPADTQHCHAPMFRKTFTLPAFERAELRFCALGMGHVWLNGRRIDEEVFGTDESVYNKTVWYRTEDVAAFLQEGENVIFVRTGNGFFNEIFPTSWDYEQACWRDHPKFIAELEIDGQILLRTDESWKCSVEGPIVYNQIRGGEHYDDRLAADFWAADYEDGGWAQAVVDTNPPGGVFRPRCCVPVVEAQVLTAKEIIDCGNGTYIFDFGVNMSGYARICVCQKAGDELVISYGEELRDGQLWSAPRGPHYPVSEYQTDHVICSGKELIWSPSFSYHGFRYIQVSGLEKAEPETVQAVFIHQGFDQVGSFRCSDERLNRLFAAGVQANWSNFVCKPTDCPTREKLGWANDLQMSCEQMLVHFDIGDFFRLYLQNARDCMREDGCLPGIIPTAGWGYHWGNGPVSEGVIFELSWQLYRYTGDPSELIRNLPYFRRSLDYFKTRENEDGFCDYGLTDWLPPQYPHAETTVPRALTNGAIVVHLLDIARQAAELAGDPEASAQLQAEYDTYRSRYMQAFLEENGRCAVHHQTALAMTVAFGLYDDLEPLKAQLMELVENADFHHDCGMVGLRRLYDALRICGLQEYAYRIITAEGYPGYYVWMDRGATTLWEAWCGDASDNHHMYSDFMGWLTRNIAGIQMLEPGMKRVRIQPAFVPQLEFCQGESRGWKVFWQRTAAGISVEFTVPTGCVGEYQGREYTAGTYTIA